VGNDSALTAIVGSAVKVDRPGSRLDVTIIGGVAYAVDHSSNRLRRLTDGPGRDLISLPANVRLASRQGSVLAPPAEVLLLAPNDRGASVIALRLDTGKQTRLFLVSGQPASQLTAPIPVGKRAIVVNTHTAVATVIDLTTGRMERQTVGRPGEHVEVQQRNGSVAVTTPSSPRGVVLNEQGILTFQKGEGSKKPNLKQPPKQPTAIPKQPSPGSSNTSHAKSPAAKKGPLDPPAAVVAVPGKSSAVIQWQPPSRTGSGLAGYDVAGDPNAPSSRVGSAATSQAVGPLTDGTAYTLRVRSLDTSGQTSPWVSAAAVTPQSDVPGAPVGVRVDKTDVGDGQVTVRWDSTPGNGTTIQRYVVAASTGQQQEVRNPSAHAGTVTALQNGTDVHFTVHAYGLVNGTKVSGDWSTPTPDVVPYGAPLAPQSVTVRSKDGGLDVSWTWPANYDNGSPVKEVRVQAQPGAQTKVITDPNQLSTSLDSLSNGTSYTVQVWAKNARGPGTRSPGQTQTPAGPPRLTLTGAGGGDRSVYATFNVDWQGSQPGTCHLVVSGVTDRAGPCDRIDVSGLMYATTYTVHVYAVSNDTGQGPDSGAANARTNDWATATYNTMAGGGTKELNGPSYGSWDGRRISSGTGVNVVCWKRGTTYTYYDNNGTAHNNYNLYVQLSTGKWIGEVEVRDSAYNNQPNGSLPQCP
jgi:hypothetical protein